MGVSAARFGETVPDDPIDRSRLGAHTAAVLPETENLPGPANRWYV